MTSPSTQPGPTPLPQPWQAPRAQDPVQGAITLPGSKSITARALVLAAISIGSSTLRGPLRARDTELMAFGLRAMGADVSTVDDDLWVVRPRPLRGPARVNVGLAGTVMRFLPPVAGSAEGEVFFDGDPRARQRPMRPLVTALRELGVRVDAAPSGGLPLTVHGTGQVAGGTVDIDASASSQLVSGLLLAAADFANGLVLRHDGPNLPSAPHIAMTVNMIRAAGGAIDDSQPYVWAIENGRLSGRGWDIEPDLSNAAPFLAAAMVTGGQVTISGWPKQTVQPGDTLRTLLSDMGARCTLDTDGLTVTGTGPIRGIDADLGAVGELTPVIAALCALADRPSRLRGIGHLRGHETDRLSALARELGKLGTEVTENADGLTITPKPLHGAVFETYDDHRLATAAAVLGLVTEGVQLTDVGCVAKTLPAFTTLWSNLLDPETLDPEKPDPQTEEDDR